MNYSRPGSTVLPPLSNRTLHHPSFMPLYMTAGFAHPGHGEGQTTHPVTPAELFYTDPTMDRGRRIPNMLRGLRVFDCSLLNAPPPAVSAHPAPPSRPDPFRSGPHPTRDLGSPTWKINAACRQVRPRRVVVQLSQEEDQAITTLLKLHHQEQSHESLGVFFGVVDSSSAEEEHKPACFDVKHLRAAGWSDTELEAADTLLSCFNLEEDVQTQLKTEKTLPVPPLSPSIQTQQNQNDTVRSVEDGSAGDCCRQGNMASPVPDLSSKTVSRWSVLGEHLEIKEVVLSDLEVDAVDVLLNLCDVDVAP